jgi:hypothetical protein
MGNLKNGAGEFSETSVSICQPTISHSKASNLLTESRGCPQYRRESTGMLPSNMVRAIPSKPLPTTQSRSSVIKRPGTGSGKREMIGKWTQSRDMEFPNLCLLLYEGLRSNRDGEVGSTCRTIQKIIHSYIWVRKSKRKR